MALAHNGNLTNAVELYNELRERGISFRGTSDSEIIAALLSVEEARPIENAVAAVMPRLEGAYSTVVMTKRAVVAFRDPHGVRPLSLGKLGDRYCVASESCAFDIIGAELMREVQPGELVSLTAEGSRAARYAGSPARPLRLRAHLLLPARFAARGPGAAGGPRPDGRDPRRARRRSTPTS